MSNRTVKELPLMLAVCLALLLGVWPGQAAAQQAATERPRLGPAPTVPAGVGRPTAVDEVAGAVPAAQADGQIFAVDPENREASRTFFITYYQNAPAPAHGWTGDRVTCNAGATSQAFRDAVLLRINYFRAMAGVPAQVTFSETYNAKAQQAALMMSVNDQLSHSPPATWLCYSAEGAEAAGKSNLALGMYGWGAITGYMQDPGTGNGAVGHRRWILYPQTQTMGTGDIPPTGGRSSNALWVFDGRYGTTRPPTRDHFVAWPPPGFVPYQAVFPRWSFSYPSADFSQASVTLARNGQTLPLVKESVANGYGENTIVWIPNGMSSWDAWPKPASDTTYRVTISNAVVGGTPQTFWYDVVVMDPSQATPKPAASDFTGDLKSDILWRHATRGEVWLWPMDGATRASELQVRTVSEPGGRSAAWATRLATGRRTSCGGTRRRGCSTCGR